MFRVGQAGADQKLLEVLVLRNRTELVAHRFPQRSSEIANQKLAEVQQLRIRNWLNSETANQKPGRIRNCTSETAHQKPARNRYCASETRVNENSEPATAQQKLARFGSCESETAHRQPARIRNCASGTAKQRPTDVYGSDRRSQNRPCTGTAPSPTDECQLELRSGPRSDPEAAATLLQMLVDQSYVHQDYCFLSQLHSLSFVVPS